MVVHPQPERQFLHTSARPDDASVFALFKTMSQPTCRAPNNQLLWHHYRDIRFPFTTCPTPEFVMQVAWNLDDLLAFIHTFSAVRRCIDAQGRYFFDQAYRAIAEQWGNKCTKRQVIFDFVFYVGIND